jgi:hypothetical protein
MNSLATMILILMASTFTLAADGINPMDPPHNAPCNGIADDSPAFRSAIDAMVAVGGPRKLTLPQGRTCKLMTPIVKHFNNTNDIIIEGSGSGSVLLLATGTSTALTLTFAHSITLRSLTIAGSPSGGSTPDANVGLSFDWVLHLLINNCQFYGTFSPEGMIRASHSNLVFTNNNLRGSTTSTGSLNGALFNVKWKSIVVKDNTFIDYGWLNGVYHSKTPVSVTLAWVVAATPEDEIIEEVIPGTPPRAGIWAQNAINITDNVFDEGALYAVGVFSNVGIGEPRTARVNVQRNNVNGPSVGSAAGFYFQNVRDLNFEQSYVGYTYSYDIPGIILENVSNASIKGSYFLQRAATIKSFGECNLTLENATYKWFETDGNTTLRLLQQGKRINRKPAPGLHAYDDLTAIASNVETIYGSPAAAASELIPTGNVFRVFGNSRIDSIRTLKIEPGTVLTLIFDGNPVVAGGPALKLEKAFIAAPDDTLSIVLSDGKFYEVSRKTKCLICGKNL